jgi:hypothetical protein
MTNMYAVRFHSNESVNLQTSSQALECKRFENRLFSSPSDRHIYTAKFYAHPIRYKEKKKNVFLPIISFSFINLIFF